VRARVLSVWDRDGTDSGGTRDAASRSGLLLLSQNALLQACRPGRPRELAGGIDRIWISRFITF
jgi:hypothetical protein